MSGRILRIPGHGYPEAARTYLRALKSPSDVGFHKRVFDCLKVVPDNRRALGRDLARAYDALNDLSASAPEAEWKTTFNSFVDRAIGSAALLVGVARHPDLKNLGEHFSVDQVFKPTIVQDTVPAIRFLSETAGIGTYGLHDYAWTPSRKDPGVAFGKQWFDAHTGDTVFPLFMETGARFGQMVFGPAYHYFLSPTGALEYGGRKLAREGRYEETAGAYHHFTSVGAEPAIILNIVRGGAVFGLRHRQLDRLRRHHITPEQIMERVNPLAVDTDRITPRQESILALVRELARTPPRPPPTPDAAPSAS